MFGKPDKRSTLFHGIVLQKCPQNSSIYLIRALMLRECVREKDREKKVKIVRAAFLSCIIFFQKQYQSIVGQREGKPFFLSLRLFTV